VRSGPARTGSASVAFCSGVNRAGRPPRRRFDSPSSPSAL
jgi:hypothetical protein